LLRLRAAAVVNSATDFSFKAIEWLYGHDAARAV